MRHLYPLDRRRDRRPLVTVGALVAALLLVRLASMGVVAQPGYTDAYYFASVAERVANGQGLTADFVWSYVEAPHFAALPVASHRFWMPLATLIQAAGIVVGGGLFGPFRAGQLAIVLVAALIPVVAYLAARSLGAGMLAAVAAGAIAGLGGALAPAWVSVDAFAPAAVLGTLFFLAFSRAAGGSIRWGAASGLLVGLLYLARAEGAIFGLALIWLAGRRRTQRSGIAGLAVALLIGLGWLVRNETLGFPDDLLARSMLLLRYEDFFGAEAPTLGAFLAAPGTVLVDRLSALLTNAVTALILVLIVGTAPIVFAGRRRWRRVEVRAFALLALAVYLVESLVFTLHSVRGSYFHSLAAFFPYSAALAAIGIEEWLAPRGIPLLRTAFAASVLAVGIVSAFALAQWDIDFNAPFEARLAAAAALPPGPLIAIDAAAWHWITGRDVIVAPADGPATASCAAVVYLSRTLILEPAHFSAYDEMYKSERSDLFTWLGDHDGIRFFGVHEDQRCVLAASP